LAPPAHLFVITNESLWLRQCGTFCCPLRTLRSPDSRQLLIEIYTAPPEKNGATPPPAGAFHRENNVLRGCGRSRNAASAVTWRHPPRALPTRRPRRLARFDLGQTKAQIYSAVDERRGVDEKAMRLRRRIRVRELVAASPSRIGGQRARTRRTP